MFLVVHKWAGGTTNVFTVQDPRRDEFEGEMIEGVNLEYSFAVHEWPHGTERPDAALGRDPNNLNHYRVFKYHRDRQAANYEAVSGSWYLLRSLAGVPLLAASGDGVRA